MIVHGAVALIALGIVAATPVSADGGAARPTRVNLSVEISSAPDAITSEALLADLARALRDADPSMTVRRDAEDRIRLTVSVRPMSATELRGFWLPFSGTYGVGSVRLAVERMVRVRDESSLMPAVVWQAERIVGTRWALAGEEVRRLVGELTAELVQRWQSPVSR